MNKTLIAISTLSVTLVGIAVKRHLDLGNEVRRYRVALEFERVKAEAKDTIPAIWRRGERV